jgi:protocadherin Fat 4
MIRKMKVVQLCVLALAVSAACSGSAYASTTGTEVVTGTTLGTLALVGTPVAFTAGFAPGQTASATGSLEAIDTNPGFTLSVSDTATGSPGHMVAAGIGCTGSEAHLHNPVSVSATTAASGVTSAGAVSISGALQTVASATAAAPGLTSFTTHFSQVLTAGEAMLTGCVYSMTSTFTLQ